VTSRTQTTRRHGTPARQAVGATSANFALPAMGPNREVYFLANTRCFVTWGDSVVTAAPGTAHPLPADDRWYVTIPHNVTHFAVVQDTAGGFITICPVG